SPNLPDTLHSDGVRGTQKKPQLLHKTAISPFTAAGPGRVYSRRGGPSAMTRKYHYIRRGLGDVQAAPRVSNEADRQISHALDELIEQVLRLEHAKAPGKVIPFAARSQVAQR